jgi:hypothetical protein
VTLHPGDTVGDRGYRPRHDRAVATFSVVALDCREPRVVAEFYGSLTGAPVERADDD